MKKLLVATAAIGTLIGTSAFAADMAVKAPMPAPAPVYSWAGFYLGISGGYGWGSNGAVDPRAAGTQNGVFVDGPAELAAQLAGLTPLNTNPRGGIAGGQIGYNFQNQQFVWGVEADFSWADIAGSATRMVNSPAVGFPPFGVTTNYSASQKLDSFGTVRGRLGITPADRFLAYVTGGLAYGETKSNIAIAQTESGAGAGDTYTPSTGAGSSWRAGWTIGAGGEWAFAQNWSIKAEYLYYDLGSLSYGGTSITGISAGGTPFTFTGISPTTQFKGSIVRAGFNWRFGG
jgi:outer membrane immunogenic protein